MIKWGSAARSDSGIACAANPTGGQSVFYVGVDGVLNFFCESGIMEPSGNIETGWISSPGMTFPEIAFSLSSFVMLQSMNCCVLSNSTPVPSDES